MKSLFYRSTPAGAGRRYMIQRKFLQNALIGSVAVAFGGARILPGANENGPVVKSAIAIMTGDTVSTNTGKATAPTIGLSKIAAALTAFQNAVRPLSDSHALTDAFNSYFAYKTAHPDQVRKPYLYFVDYGLPSTTARGYVFDMSSLKIVDGPFMVAHGRGSSANQYG